MPFSEEGSASNLLQFYAATKLANDPATLEAYVNALEAALGVARFVE